MTPLAPYCFQPVFVEKPWGGSKLPSLSNATWSATTPVGEAWLFSDLADGTTLVSDGPDAGLGPRELLEKHGPALVGPDFERFGADGFPFLLKLLDTEQALSLQVHPDDDAAKELEGEPRGKSEAWYILDAKEQALVYLGTQAKTNPAALVRDLKSGSQTALQSLFTQSVNPGDFIPVPSGTLHAIGAGVTLAEIQQSSNTTYRVYDWGRTGRPLHTEKAARCMLSTPWQPPHRQAITVSDDGGAIELLGLTNDFIVERITLRGRLELPCEEPGFSLLLALSDSISITTSEGTVAVPSNRAMLIPASCPSFTLAVREPVPKTVLRFAVTSSGLENWRGQKVLRDNSTHF